MSNVLDSIKALGISAATEAKTACGQIEACDQIDETAIDSIRAILRNAGDVRADLASLGYRPAGCELMRAYASGWDEVASA